MVAISLQEFDLHSAKKQESKVYNCESIRIGRIGGDNDIYTDNPYVSRKHVTLIHNGREWFVFNHSSQPTHIVRGSQTFEVPKTPQDLSQRATWMPILPGDILVLSQSVGYKILYNK